MTAHMEKVREMMDTLPITYKGRKWDAALAEVEEWEAEVQRLGDDVAEQALRIIDLGQKENEAVARAEAAEAEADRLKAALRDAEFSVRRYLETEQDERFLMDALAALVPADRNTT